MDHDAFARAWHSARVSSVALTDTVLNAIERDRMLESYCKPSNEQPSRCASITCQICLPMVCLQQSLTTLTQKTHAFQQAKLFLWPAHEDPAGKHW